MFAEVIVDISHGDVDRIFEYSLSNCKVFPGSRVLVPFGAKIIEGIVIRIKDTSDYPREKIKDIKEVLEETPALTDETLALAMYIAKTCYVTKAQALRLFLPSEMRKGKVKEKFIKVLNYDNSCNFDEILSKLKKSAEKQRAFLCFIEAEKRIDQARANETFGAQAVKAIIDKGACFITEEQVFRSPYKDIVECGKKVTLTDRQQQAVESVENSDKMTTLIFGVTGSGKTEVYLQIIDDVIGKGKTAIFLVPEISLTPQMLKILRSRFGERAAILHSGLSAGERYDEWWRLRSGEAKIAIGARSAIFAPLENVGVIIIDEEHDGSYVSESAPRYQTIDVAKFRAEYSNAKIVLGSATPSIDSYLNAKDGIYNLAVLPDRINKKPLPNIEIVDMRREIRHGNNSPFSSALKEEIKECIDKGNQAIIFLNQRGFSKTVICTECGHVQKCSSCDVSLTYHKEDESLICHYCGAKYKMIKACTECGSPYIRYGGFGTERVCIELQKIFPNAKILRMDRDTTQNKEGHFKILSDFANHKADILVGTQMIAKGHDFPSVTLVGILDADQSLHFSDFRSGERTFQLLTQVSGRSGRASETGKVVLQTYSPDNPVLTLAINYNYEGFFEHEISVRKATAFPPYTIIARVLISGIDEEKTLNVTKALFEELSLFYNENKDSFRFFGHMKAPVKKIQNKFRNQVLMRIDSEKKNLLDTIFMISNKYNSQSTNVYLEINPNNLT